MINKFCYLNILLLPVSQVIFCQTDTVNVNHSSVVTNKRGIEIGPQKGDWALGISATPFLNYMGNMLKISDENNTAPDFGFTAQNPGMISIKYMKSDNTAIGLAFRIGLSHRVDKDGSGFDNDDIDKYISSAANFGLTLSLEKSPFMKSRLRGFYGWSAAMGVTPYFGQSYGNPGLFVSGKYKYVDSANDDANFVEKGGNTISAGVGGFTGLEFFIAPKISLAGQFNLMLSYGYQLKRNYVPETGDDVVIDSGSSSFRFDNMASGSLVLTGYF
jgi:hypothetical protein